MGRYDFDFDFRFGFLEILDFAEPDVALAY